MDEMDDDRPPRDGFEKSIRFGCGFLFGGLVVAVVALVWEFFSAASSFWIATGTSAIVCGLLTVRYGDRFFRVILKFLNW